MTAKEALEKAKVNTGARVLELAKTKAKFEALQKLGADTNINLDAVKEAVDNV